MTKIMPHCVRPAISVGRWSWFAAVLALASVAHAAGPVVIQYTLSGNTYSYAITNNMVTPVTDFSIFFPDVSAPDALNYTLNSVTSPGGWSSLLLQPSAINLGGAAEWFGGSIPAGGTLGGFGVNFSYNGSGTPGNQFFAVWDPVDITAVTTTGLTQPGQPQPPVPDEVSTFACVLLGLALAATRSLWRGVASSAR